MKEKMISEIKRQTEEEEREREREREREGNSRFKVKLDTMLMSIARKYRVESLLNSRR